MKKALYVIFLLSFVMSTFTQCDCLHYDNADEACFEFDRRQCDGDEWSDVVPINTTKEEQEENMAGYLESKGIETIEVNWIADFHTSVCEACFVCPIGDRFQVRINAADEEKLKGLELLNLDEIDCGDL